MFQPVRLLIVSLSLLLVVESFRFHAAWGVQRSHQMESSQLQMGARNRAWTKGVLSDKDIFDEDDNNSSAKPKGKRSKPKVDPEVTEYEGPPSKVELLVPTLSILTVIGIIPFLAALTRQFWVKYKITSKRININSGFRGKTFTEVIYPEIEEIRYVYRALGAAGDMVLFLKGGARVEMRFVPDFPRLYKFMLSRCTPSCQAKSMKLKE